MVTNNDIQQYGNLPSQVPQQTLDEHREAAQRDVDALAGGAVVENDSRYPAYREAIIVKALASSLPFIHTFYLQGAAKVGRLEGTVEARFLDPEEVQALQDQLEDRYDELTPQLSVTEDNATDEPLGTQAGDIWMEAV